MYQPYGFTNTLAISMLLLSLIPWSLAFISVKGVNSENTMNTFNVDEVGESTSLTPFSNCPNLNWNIKSDAIFIIDTSESFRESAFNETRDFIRDMLRLSTILNDDFTRIAVLTFAEETTTVLDYISLSGGAQLPECELFRQGGVWDEKVRFKLQNGENIYDALQESLEILQRGRSRRSDNDYVQRVWIATDMRRFKDAKDQGPALQRLKQVAEVYGIGLGEEHLKNESERFLGYVSSPPHCFYDTYPRWEVKKTDFKPPLLKASNPLGDWLSYVDQTGCGCSGVCECREFSVGEERCGENESMLGIKNNKRPDWSIILGGIAGGIFFLLVIIGIAVFACEIRKYNKKKKQRPPFPIISKNIATCTDSIHSLGDQSSQRTNTTTLSSETSDTSIHAIPIDDSIYQNQIVTDIIEAHTLERNQPAPPLPPRDRGVYCTARAPSSCPTTPAPILPYYEKTEDHVEMATSPIPPHRQSGPYSHVITNHSRQQSRTSQITVNSCDSHGYLKMVSTLPARTESETQTTFAARMRKLHRRISGFFVSTSKARETQTNEATTPETASKNAQTKKKATNRKYEQNTAAKRLSAKFGTARFKTLLTKFDPEESTNGPTEIPVSSLSRQSSRLDDL